MRSVFFARLRATVLFKAVIFESLENELIVVIHIKLLRVNDGSPSESLQFSLVWLQDSGGDGPVPQWQTRVGLPVGVLPRPSGQEAGRSPVRHRHGSQPTATACVEAL